MTEKAPGENENPVLKLDYPDPDVIRVGDTYYMVSTSMHFMPGCEILRSFDLIHWEHAAFVYDRLDGTMGQRLDGTEHIYGKGMWAASLRFHQGMFYLCFAANDTKKTYLFTSSEIAGPWEKRQIEGFYHDCSLLFDEGCVYIVYGNKQIYLTELKPDLSGPLENGVNRMIVNDEGNDVLGYEGSHFYKINGKYYLFLIHSLPDCWRRVEACFVSDSIDGKFAGGDILNDDMGYCGQGVAQGGIVDTLEHKWYAILFQDRGASGRMPVLIPVTWKDDMPAFGTAGKIPVSFQIKSTRPEYRYWPLLQSDDFGDGDEEVRQNGPANEKQAGGIRLQEQNGCFGLKSVWQFNHEPELSLVHRDYKNKMVRIETGKLCRNLTQAKNVLTQRMCYPGCSGEVTVDVEALNEGDYAGISAFMSCYGMIALTKREDCYYVVMCSRNADDDSLMAMPEDDSEGTEWEAVPIKSDHLRLKVEVDFTDRKDEAQFFYQAGDDWIKIGITHKLYFKMDHFTGCRFGLFVYATHQMGGMAGFRDFVYQSNF